ncbi:hypothetical protein [Pseudomonas sp. B392_1p]|uniref:hypothetical protein n=1 Tax=Pseudomonas sp. B392_1p TaxID=3457507 RepID=UPI003FD03420
MGAVFVGACADPACRTAEEINNCIQVIKRMAYGDRESSSFIKISAALLVIRDEPF